ncbi:hypothetical protein [Nitrosomonas nitrosa]|uniref:hypothetical protein n=1 Tax=Nitrosomonas nitrosa TaxID=52442 RepID=UPI00195DC1BE|nr:hypothetical protein [Nitrosomonas nitrosa]
MRATGQAPQIPVLQRADAVTPITCVLLGITLWNIVTVTTYVPSLSCAAVTKLGRHRQSGIFEQIRRLCRCSVATKAPIGGKDDMHLVPQFTLGHGWMLSLITLLLVAQFTEVWSFPPMNGHIMICLKEKKDDTKLLSI